MNMDIPEHHRWMVNRLNSERRGLTEEFIQGVEEFDKFARLQRVFEKEGIYRCPFFWCENGKHLSPEEVKVHLYKRGFSHIFFPFTAQHHFPFSSTFHPSSHNIRPIPIIIRPPPNLFDTPHHVEGLPHNIPHGSTSTSSHQSNSSCERLSLNLLLSGLF